MYLDIIDLENYNRIAKYDNYTGPIPSIGDSLKLFFKKDEYCEVDDRCFIYNENELEGVTIWIKEQV